MKELDHEHRKRLRSAFRLMLSMRYLAAALERWRGSTDPAIVRPVPRPPQGTVALTWVGHATMMLTTAGTRLLTDPLLERSLYGLRRAKAAGIDRADLSDVDLVLLSHAHRDHLSQWSLRRLPPGATAVVPPRCSSALGPLRRRFAQVVELEPGQSLCVRDAEVTAVPVRHSGGGGRRGACGYVVATQGTSLYVAGDTGYFSGFAEIGRRFHPDVALLPIGGYEPAGFREEHLSPLDALYAFEDLGARVLIPTSYGSFPLSYEPLDAPLAWLREAARERGLSRQVAILDHGETCTLGVTSRS
jgi:L-ascorbate metabolism protein UlaG (beta-lactamase superfamily)